jgi:phytoene/squalene synthetase
MMTPVERQAALERAILDEHQKRTSDAREAKGLLKKCEQRGRTFFLIEGILSPEMRETLAYHMTALRVQQEMRDRLGDQTYGNVSAS